MKFMIFKINYWWKSNSEQTQTKQTNKKEKPRSKRFKLQRGPTTLKLKNGFNNFERKKAIFRNMG